MAKSELHRDYILEMENELQEFEMKAAATHKRMQMLVYPSMFAFFVLSIFGFFLIFSLTSDVNRMADTIAHMSGSLDNNMSSISGDMNQMSVKMDSLVDSTNSMSSNLTNMTQNTDEMVTSIGGMRTATYDMAASTNNMQRDMWSMNKNISTPLSFMNNFLPWKNSQSMPFPGSRAPLPQSYFAYPAEQPVSNYQQDIPMPVPVSPAGSSYQVQPALFQQSMSNDQGPARINSPYLAMPAISMN
ncbi:hypothetical protein GCM10009133_34950 [Cocleimonas flava]|jgi:uncharacterized protein YoxC|uniref:Uncharacterized protein n=1 Tax=Cocleimonas flava TaxID=634765 RepID=A0A4R1F7K7_9GAMM|nr:MULTISPECIES: hypothetical protein [Cocleimonas]MEB8430965.1 hypothetical protein [Cocleimonas sp. KMM 6892]MEC4714263.1 hypothetical protein [Cocleimonas sp. KMM 6895]MEC4743594.1 hypothetical protein [Cocleimonas sp. KMM 6896]TCJ88662.1 hypothetical protein EV695_0520 [Cocleimonas flava]